MSEPERADEIIADMQARGWSMTLTGDDLGWEAEFLWPIGKGNFDPFFVGYGSSPVAALLNARRAALTPDTTPRVEETRG